jgi:hypothetical protein
MNIKMYYIEVDEKIGAGRDERWYSTIWAEKLTEMFCPNGLYAEIHQPLVF